MIYQNEYASIWTLAAGNTLTATVDASYGEACPAVIDIFGYLIDA